MKENTELQALLYLLEDPDPEIFRQIKQRFFQYGDRASKALNEHLVENRDPLVHKRVAELTHEMHYQVLVDRYKYWIESSHSSLLEGLSIITSYRFHELDVDNLKAGVRAIKKDIWDAFGNNLSPAQAIHALNEVFFHRYGFEVQPSSQLEESDLFFHETLINRTGCLTTIGLLYAAIAAELNLPIYIVAVPEKQFLLAYMSQFYDSTRDFKDYPIDAHFFIDPASFGSTYVRAEAYKKFVKNAGPKQMSDCLYPLSNVESVQLLLEEMASFYKKKDLESNYEEVLNLLRISTEYIERKLRNQ